VRIVSVHERVALRSQQLHGRRVDAAVRVDDERALGRVRDADAAERGNADDGKERERAERAQLRPRA
jgi:hypothetical protein